MPNFIGFSTIDRYKKFTLIDLELIKRDLLNALLIRAGQMPGRPEVGTKIWDYIFEPNDSSTISSITQEITRLIELDTRIELHAIEIASETNTIQAHVSISLLIDNSVEEFYINFNKDTQTADIT